MLLPLSTLRSRREQPVRLREERRIRRELQDARRLQLGMLPPASYESAALELAALALPAHEVGGDYFDYLELPDGRLAVVMADVAGHGLGSSLVLFGVRSCVHLLGADLSRPGSALERLSTALRSTGAGVLVTLQLLLLDAGAGRATLATAGHPPLLHRRGRGAGTRAWGLGGPPLGTGLPCRYGEISWRLERGDLLLLHTDGLVEIRDRTGREYGSERLREALTRTDRAGSARAVRDGLLADFSSFRGDERPQDDVTLAVVRIK